MTVVTDPGEAVVGAELTRAAMTEEDLADEAAESPRPARRPRVPTPKPRATPRNPTPSDLPDGRIRDSRIG